MFVHGVVEIIFVDLRPMFVVDDWFKDVVVVVVVVVVAHEFIFLILFGETFSFKIQTKLEIGSGKSGKTTCSPPTKLNKIFIFLFC